MPQPRLVPVREPRHPDGVVLVLHGGAARRDRAEVSPTQLSVLRMVPVARRIARVGRVGGGRGLAVFRVLNSTRGWDTGHTPVDDALWALDEVARRLGALPTCLVGHSLGGRAALLAGSAAPVVGVAALNAWIAPADHATLAGRRVLMVHGTADRVADPRRARRLGQEVAGTAASFGWLDVQDGKHAMLRRGSVFERAAADFATATLLDRAVGEPVSELLEGVASLTI
ncbi:alpha/beta fold hydrolase [Nocardioides aurantiacus]|uniref:Alpha/beta hydrolase family protein n=1 Tax=Nocardioides aurantiacus TaxID=86796 RepID=A0A3N2CSY3_9ACTN|nr:alpha/beta fold hydrolase [Nocardioides aurantiacus]ROR90653.1 hypothetical protein EDD33_1500 [Nocardioides aurantiacus]